MAKLLSGRELQGFIKERQLRQVRNLRQQHDIIPRLLIIKSPTSGPVIDTYIKMKVAYAQDIGIEVEVNTIAEEEIKARIELANFDSKIQGIIVQLPLKNSSQTNSICDKIDSFKDVDGLGHGGVYPSATAQAIDWLLAGYNVDLDHKHITIVGNGKLVGNPLGTMWKNRGLQVTILDDQSSDIEAILLKSDVIVSATGAPNLIQSKSIRSGAVVVDAGTASEHGKIVGDVAEEARGRDDITITPVRGGVGPLTYAVLFDHLIEACLRRAGRL